VLGYKAKFVEGVRNCLLLGDGFGIEWLDAVGLALERDFEYWRRDADTGS